MRDALVEFHSLKHVILEEGVHRGKQVVLNHFDLPKLELMQSFATSVDFTGSLPQWTADVSEHLLITHCKQPFEQTSKQKDFADQIVQLLDQAESMHLFDLYALLCSSDLPLTNAIENKGEDLSVYVDPTTACVSHVLPNAECWFNSPRPFQNHFTSGILSDDTFTAFHLTVAPNMKNMPLTKLKLKYNLGSRLDALVNFAYRSGAPETNHSFLAKLGFNVWNKFCI